jgi:hypothetical protein
MDKFLGRSNRTPPRRTTRPWPSEMLLFIGLSWCTTLIDGLDMVNQFLVFALRYGGLAISCWHYSILTRRVRLLGTGPASQYQGQGLLQSCSL